jgi:hypothetical protein
MFSKITAPTISKTPAYSISNGLAPVLIPDAVSRLLGFKLQDLVLFLMQTLTHTIPRKNSIRAIQEWLKWVERYTVLSGNSTLHPVMQCMCCLVPKG